MTGKHRGSKRRWRRRSAASSARRQVEYPIGTVAYYGPDDRTVTKIVAGVITSENATPIIKRWKGEGIAKDPLVNPEIVAFFKSHGVRNIAITDGILGCPHEEGIDFPRGQECPYCPFWEGKQGIVVRDEE